MTTRGRHYVPGPDLRLCEIHCWHTHVGPIWLVVPDGHVNQKCCKCSATRTIHRDHVEDTHGK